jgi:hypothetical protein
MSLSKVYEILSDLFLSYLQICTLSAYHNCFVYQMSTALMPTIGELPSSYIIVSKLDCRLNAAIWWCQSKITQFNNLITRHDFVNICKKQMEPFPFDRFYICLNLCHNNYTTTFKILDTFIYFLLGYGCQRQRGR